MKSTGLPQPLFFAKGHHCLQFLVNLMRKKIIYVLTLTHVFMSFIEI